LELPTARERPHAQVKIGSLVPDRRWLTVAGPTGLITAIVVILVLVSTTNAFYGNLVIATLIAAILALAFNMIGGFGGRLAFGNQLFFGLGAYAIAVGSVHNLWPPLAGLGIGIALSFVLALGLGLILARLTGMLFALATFALALIVMGIFSVTGWLGGEAGLEEPLRLTSSITALSFSSTWELALAAGIVVILATACTTWLALSGWGAKLKSARDDRVAAETCGVNARQMQALVWGISAGITAIAGAVFLQNSLIVEPTTVFGFNSGIEVIVPAIVGGLGTVVGPVIGSGVIFVGGLLNQLSANGSSVGLSEFLYGAILVLTVRAAPGGILGLLRSAASAIQAWTGRPGRGAESKASTRTTASTAAEPTALSAGESRRGIQTTTVGFASGAEGSRPSGKDAAAPETLLRISGVSKSFGAVSALADVSFEVKSGTVVGLIGPNGSGKTTLFNCITGVIAADRGSIVLENQELVGLRPYQVARSGVARTYQTVRLFATASALENVEIPLLWRMTKAHAGQEAAAALDAVGLSGKAHQLPAALGLADRRKLELCRAIVTGSKVILLDEVMAGLSRSEAEVIGQLIASLSADKGISFVVVEHVMEQLVTVCTDAVVMDLGRVLAQGPPAEVLARPEVLRAYFGVPAGAES
jgi:branched-chain amino acid transport system permease protein